MKLNSNFVTYDNGKENLMVSMDSKLFSGLVRGNSTVGVILEALKEDTTVEKIAQAMADKYDAPIEQITADVEKVVAQLRSIKAIEE